MIEERQNWTAKDVMELRAHLKLSRQNFADIVGVSHVTVFQWEKGTVRPVRFLDRLNEIARTCVVTDKRNGGGSITRIKKRKSKPTKTKSEPMEKSEEETVSEDPDPEEAKKQDEKTKVIRPFVYERVTQTDFRDLMEEINVMAEKGYRLVQIIIGAPHHAILECRSRADIV